MTALWSTVERGEALRRAERDGVDLLVVGGGITGAGVLRDAASRGLRALLGLGESDGESGAFSPSFFVKLPFVSAAAVRGMCE